MKRIEVSERTFDLAERARRKLGLRRHEFYTRAVEAMARRAGLGTVRNRLDSVYAEIDGSLDPLLDHVQAEALREEW